MIAVTLIGVAFWGLVGVFAIAVLCAGALFVEHVLDWAARRG